MTRLGGGDPSGSILGRLELSSPSPGRGRHAGAAGRRLLRLLISPSRVCLLRRPPALGPRNARLASSRSVEVMSRPPESAAVNSVEFQPARVGHRLLWGISDKWLGLRQGSTKIQLFGLLWPDRPGRLSGDVLLWT